MSTAGMCSSKSLESQILEFLNLAGHNKVKQKTFFTDFNDD